MDGLNLRMDLSKQKQRTTWRPNKGWHPSWRGGGLVVTTKVKDEVPFEERLASLAFYALWHNPMAASGVHVQAGVCQVPFPT